jgi:hypothetical protein
VGGVKDYKPAPAINETIVWHKHCPQSGVPLLVYHNGRIGIGYKLTTTSTDTHYGLDTWIVDGRPERWVDWWACLPKGPQK